MNEIRTECFAWIQRLYMSGQRYMALREEKREEFGENSARYAMFQRMCDGDQVIGYVGKEKEVRKLAAEKAREYGVKRWRLIPMPRKNFLYNGGKASYGETEDGRDILLARPEKNDTMVQE